MAHAVCLQEWATVQGASSTTVVHQDEQSWLNLAAFQDVALYLDVADFGGDPLPVVESAPSKDEPVFQALFRGAGPIGSTGLQPLRIARFADNRPPPLATWVRWSISGSSAWSLTFRIWLSVVPSRGMLIPIWARSQGQYFHRGRVVRRKWSPRDEREAPEPPERATEAQRRLFELVPSDPDFLAALPPDEGEAIQGDLRLEPLPDPAWAPAIPPRRWIHDPEVDRFFTRPVNRAAAGGTFGPPRWHRAPSGAQPAAQRVAPSANDGSTGSERVG